ncbi:hypothetical protein DSO57_1027181 [Entomophthora muscae]|uniref:Uncharacterized protein n=1 Tax=Entomophthora muscae TaxID=34485 RepID=A0ACC2T1X4_9FUNG|nr:hypothetical protein DSO57_1027181 [Entomophthora muscae]
MRNDFLINILSPCSLGKLRYPCQRGSSRSFSSSKAYEKSKNRLQATAFILSRHFNSSIRCRKEAVPLKPGSTQNTPKKTLFSRVPDSLLKSKSSWTSEMDRMLLETRKSEAKMPWNMFAMEYFPKFTGVQIYRRYTYITLNTHKGKWSDKELYLLKQAVSLFGSDWGTTSKHVATRSPAQCKRKWDTLVSPEIGRTAWSASESERLVRLVLESPNFKMNNRSPNYTQIDWEDISKWFPNKTRHMCRYHFLTNLCGTAREKFKLAPFDKGLWTPQQTAKLISLVEQHSTNWTLISSELRTRSPLQCKSHWKEQTWKKKQIISGVPLKQPKLKFWTPVEDEALLRMYRLLGKQWMVMSLAEPTLTSRTDRAIQSRYRILQNALKGPWFTLLPTV